MPAKVYAVAAGRRTGVFPEWSGPDGAQAQVDRYPGARHRSFPTEEEARTWLAQQPLHVSRSSASIASVAAAPPAGASSPQTAAPVVLNEAPEVTVHLACLSGVPESGTVAYGALLLHRDNEVLLSGVHCATTPNRQELRALAEALEYLKCPCRVIVSARDNYASPRIADGRVARWRVALWSDDLGGPVQHADLWARIAPHLDRHTVRFVAAGAGPPPRLDAALESALASAAIAQDDAQPPWQADPPE
jgi:ribonuclease HI